jgi:halogenation protein CepH
MDTTWDVVVVGGGPAGSTVSGLLARRGYRVLMLEREKFPRYHIGESLVPGVIPVLEELGLAERINEFGFVRKYGITLAWGKQPEPWTVYFGEGGPFEYAFQVVRSEFDYLLLQNARRLGATVIEEAEVVDFTFDDGRCTGVDYRVGSRNESATARLVVDASGQAHILGRRLGLLDWDDKLRNVATWAYFEGGDSLPGQDAGNILVEHCQPGWLWVIPLHDGLQSVGWVSHATNLRGRNPSSGETLLEAIEASRHVRPMLARARLASGFRTIRDWSYKCRAFQGPGFLLTGDAAGFVDPLFSTGVFLALKGGTLTARAADRILSGEEAEAVVGEEYQASYCDFLDNLFSFIKFFYDASKDKELYWGRARELIDPSCLLTTRQDFVYLISGLGGASPVMELSEVAALVTPEPVDAGGSGMAS